MPLVTDIYPSKYLSAADLQGREVRATIDRVEMDEFEDNGRKCNKPVVYFKGGSKGLVCNKTNTMAIKEITGQENTDNWPGATIVLYGTMVQFGNKTTEAVRVRRAPMPAVHVAQATAPAPVAGGPGAVSAAAQAPAAPTPTPTPAPAPATQPEGVPPLGDPLNDSIPF